MSQYDVIGILLWQAITQQLPGRTTIGGARDTQATVDSHSGRIGYRWHHPGSFAVIGIGRDRKTEMYADFGYADFLPGFGAVFAKEYTAVILLPEMVGLRGTRRHEVWVVPPIGFGVGQIIHQHATIAALPAYTAVSGFQHAG